jgi:Domain of unknown function (DUF4190)/zinc-ribbon domain
MFCSKCGMANADTRQSCTKCGAKLPLGRSTTRNFNLRFANGTAAGAAVARAPEPSPQAASQANENPVAGFASAPLSLGIQREYPAFITSRPATSAPSVPALPPKPKASRKAVASFIFGVLFPVLPSAIAAIIYGRRARSEITESHDRLRGAAMARAGVVLGWLGVVLFTGATVSALYAHLAHSPEARQTSAMGALRTMNSALISYGAQYGNGFPSNIAILASGDPRAGDCNHAAMIDPRLASGTKNGYVFRYTPVFPDHRSTPQISPKAEAANCLAGGASGYIINADPAEPAQPGAMHFYTDQTGIIRYSADSPAEASSDALR